jgi:pyruvate,orthophosphate dikinase
MMAFGNMGETSGTGVAFTRNPATGEKKLMGEFLINAQGEDVVAGVRTPQPIAQLEDTMPEVFGQFVDIWKTITETCRIWSSPLRTNTFICSRPETEREPQKQPSKLPVIW